MIKKICENRILEVFSDNLFSIHSTDNERQYDVVYSEDCSRQDESYSPKYGIILKDTDENTLKTAIIIGSASGATTPHENSVVVDAENIVVAIGGSIICLDLETLKSKWEIKTDNSYTCFAVYRFLDHFVAHCEGSIISFKENGKINWEFTGRDIFVTPDGVDDFNIEGDKIVAKDWDGNTYRLTLEGHEERLL